MTISADRCPRCGGALKPGAQWCGLCYADLRPPPPAPEPVAPPAPAAVPAAPLFAPVRARDALDGDEAAEAAGPEDDGVATETPGKGWPCVECGTMNPFALEVCAGCGLPFGSALRTPVPTLPGDRRTRLIVASFIALALVALIAVLSMATGSPKVDEPDPSAPIILEQE